MRAASHVEQSTQPPSPTSSRRPLRTLLLIRRTTILSSVKVDINTSVTCYSVLKGVFGTMFSYLIYSLNARCIVLAALSSLFHILVEDTISSSFLVGNCFLNLTSICSCNCLNVSVSSTCPRTCLTNEWRMSRQWILFPLAMGRLKLTNATVFGLDIPRGGSREAMKSES